MDLQKKQPDKEPITDATLTRSIVISVIGILCCMACLFGATWAWFTSSVSTASNTITAASFDVRVKVEAIEQNGEEIIAGADGYYTLDPQKSYLVTLVKTGTATSGFCHLSIKTNTGLSDAATVYFTKDIKDEPYKFTLIKGVSAIRFTPMWGECPEDGQYAKIEGPLVEFELAPIELPPEQDPAENSAPETQSQDETSDTPALQEQSAP